MSRRFALSVLLLALLGLAGAPTGAEEPKAGLKEKVKQLVEQLADPDEKKQEAAAMELFKLGPAVLPHLPGPGTKLKPAQARHLAVIRKTLREAQTKKNLAPKLVTIQDESIPLTKALALLEKQTDVKVKDLRQDQTDVKLKLNLEQATFWQALDAIAEQADARIYLYRADGIALVDGPHVALPVSYNGIFRVVVKRLLAVRDLETDARYYVATMEIAWEPRFKPFLIDTRPQALTIKDDKNRELLPPDEGGSKVPVESPFAMTVDLRLPAVPRAVSKLNLLKGSMVVVGPTQMLEFTFDTLDVLEKDPKAREQTQDGVTVKLDKPAFEKSRSGAAVWKFGVSLEYPPDGPDFESFQSWVVHNEIYLVKEGANERLANNAGYATDNLTKNRASLTYNFVEEKKKPLGKPGDWKLVYLTPGAISEVPVPFEFKDLPLP
jgi:hypothetical protein